MQHPLTHYTMALVMILFSTLIYSAQQYQRPSDIAIKQKLTPLQYAVTQEKGTEPPYNNAYWNNKQPGIYVDIVTEEPLFSSLDKYDSKTGWPSFTKPLEPNNIVLKADKGWFITRIEVLSKVGQSHLGHVLDDGPPPTYKRYCMNSAALLFIPVDQLQQKGYGKYLPLFKQAARPSH